MKKLVIPALALSLVLTPLAASVAEAGHRSHRHYHRHDDLSVGEALALVLVTGLVVAAVGADSQSYVGAPWGVVDTEIQPKNADVYIDGGFAGQAKSFDGWPGYLPLEPGTYDLEFREAGYETFRVRARVLAGRRLVIKKKLRRLSSEERRSQPEDLPPPPPPARGDERDQDWRWDEPERRDPRGEQVPPPPEERTSSQPPAPRNPAPSTNGRPPVLEPNEPTTPEREMPPGPADDLPAMSELRLDLEPEDASVYIDGQFYVNGKDLDGGSRAILLSPGEYKLEVVRPGYKTQSYTVVLGSEPRTLKIRMARN
jgi:hypothetical protein